MGNNTDLIAASPGTLTAAVLATDTVLNLSETGTLIVGDLLRLENIGSTGPNPGSGLGLPFELVRITAIDSATNQVTVSRGVLSTPVAHNNGIVVIRPNLRTFTLSRTKLAAFDVNSFITAGGNINPTDYGTINAGWFWGGARAYQPWGSTAPPVLPPLSGGFQPDCWHPPATPAVPTNTGPTTLLTALPASGMATASSGTTPGKVNTTAGATVTPVANMRWTDDQPVGAVPQCPPFGSADLWLRIEKATNATTGLPELRFLWRNGSSSSFTPLTRNADGTGGEVRLNIDPWFDLPVVTTASMTSAAAANTVGSFVFPSAALAATFAPNDMVQIGTSELGYVTSVVGTTVGIMRGQQGTAAPAIAATTVDVKLLRTTYLGPNMQLSLCEQGGPRYWTKIAANVPVSGDDIPATLNQTWTVTSTAGMKTGDVVTLGNAATTTGNRQYTERVRIDTVVDATRINVTRNYDAGLDINPYVIGCQLPGYPSGSFVYSLSNTLANATSLIASNISISTSVSAIDPLVQDFTTIDKNDWEAAGGGVSASARYLASQYQVFFGPLDITEDFFTWSSPTTGESSASEDWIYNPREFWSQSRWWDTAHTIQKDVVPVGFNDDITTVRSWLSKTTLLTLNLSAVQEYLRTRTLNDAVADVFLGAGAGAAPVVTNGTDLLRTRFNGLFYLVRTNRYPTNPTPGLVNPWNHHLPNTTDDMASLISAYPNIDAANRSAMQPYDTLVQDPAFRPQQFIQGVRIVNGSQINWGLTGTDAFGASKTTIATPNQLFLQGDLNTTAFTVNYQGGTPQKLTPLAVMGDAVTLLSNAWTDSKYKEEGLVLSGTHAQPHTWTVTGGGTLAMNQGSSGKLLPAASSTSYYASILTHNQPTTRESIRQGESSAFINTMLYLEDWVGKDMNFLGSLVVMDSRRYCSAFLLDSPKTYGQTPFGFISNTGLPARDTVWLANYSSWYGFSPTLTQSQWGGQIGSVQGPPARNMDFNYDLMTEAGTPPFTPFGVTASGVGAWSRIVE
ncbi:MAG: hypothetical protein AAB263_11820 [Planctomycetota bacterium]